MHCSCILFGPPGTGKTTLIESLAATAGVDLVVVSPSDIMRYGAGNIHNQATSVMKSLSYLSRTVILFDEFDPMLRSRSAPEKAVSSEFDALTNTMLTLLSGLDEAAKERRTVYALATNYYDRLDEAAVREQRFDGAIGVYPPDPPSRIVRLLFQLSEWVVEHPHHASRLQSADVGRRLAEIVDSSAGVATVSLIKRGVLTKPKQNESLARYPIWNYLINGSDKPGMSKWPMPLYCKEITEAGLDAVEGDKAPLPAARQSLNRERLLALASMKELALIERTEIQIIAEWNRSVHKAALRGRTTWTGENWMEITEIPKILSTRSGYVRLDEDRVRMRWVRVGLVDELSSTSDASSIDIPTIDHSVVRDQHLQGKQASVKKRKRG